MEPSPGFLYAPTISKSAFRSGIQSRIEAETEPTSGSLHRLSSQALAMLASSACVVPSDSPPAARCYVMLAIRALLDPKGIMMPPALAASSGIKLEPCGRGNGSPGLPEGWFNAAMLRPSLLTSPMPGWEPVQRASEAAAWEMELRERQQRGVTEEDNKGAEHQIRLSRWGSGSVPI